MPSTLCPCGCGRRLPLSQTQIADVTVYRRAHNEIDVADDYNCAVSTIRHVREVWRSDGSIKR